MFFPSKMTLMFNFNQLYFPQSFAQVYCISMYHIIQTTHLGLNKGILSLIHWFQNIQKLFGQDLKTGGCQGKL